MSEKALTLEQLREMDGEPSWVVRKDVGGRWVIINLVSINYVHTFGCGALEAKYCGKYWLAYRRKPEDKA